MTAIQSPGANILAASAPTNANSAKATSLLILVAVLWGLLSYAIVHWHLDHGFWQVLKLGLEAGMVGGLADWYAITVLFRDPFGRIWVPAIIRDHTSIIPRKKDKIATELGRFVQQHFLAPQHVEDSLRHHDLVGNVAKAALDEEKVKAISRELKHVALEALSMVDEPEIERMVQQIVVEWIKTLDVHLVLHEVLSAATANGVHQDALQWGLEELDELLQKNGDVIADIVKAKIKNSGKKGFFASWFINAREDVVFKVIQEVRVVMNDEQHPVRQTAEKYISQYIYQLRQDDSDSQKQVLSLRDNLVSSPEIVGFFTKVVRNVIDSIMLDLLRSNSRITTNIERTVRDIATRMLLAEQEGVRELINKKTVEIAVHFSREYSESAVQYISEKVGSWDATTMTSIIEEKVGDDLHAIRINGVIVGGVIGLLIGVAGILIG